MMPKEKKNNQNLENNGECDVCYDNIERNFVFEACGHKSRLCFDCLKDYFSKKSKDSIFPLVCPEKGCKERVIWRDLTLILDGNLLEKIIGISYQNYLNKFNNVLRQCNYMGCQQIFRSDSKIHVCDQCSKVLCVNCSIKSDQPVDFHEFSCSVIENDSLQKKILLESLENTALCPTCNIVIQKNEGCAHVHCTFCNTHFCWKCSKSFPQNKIYQHGCDM